MDRQHLRFNITNLLHEKIKKPAKKGGRPSIIFGKKYLKTF